MKQKNTGNNFTSINIQVNYIKLEEKKNRHGLLKSFHANFLFTLSRLIADEEQMLNRLCI